MWNTESLSGLGGREKRRAAVPRMCDVRTFVLRSLLSWCLVLKWEKTMETNTPSDLKPGEWDLVFSSLGLWKVCARMQNGMATFSQGGRL